jgi:hypothetical protein
MAANNKTASSFATYNTVLRCCVAGPPAQPYFALTRQIVHLRSVEQREKWKTEVAAVELDIIPHRPAATSLSQ